MIGRRRVRCVALPALLTVMAAGCGGEPEPWSGGESSLANVPPPVAEAFRRLDAEITPDDRETLRTTPPGEMVRYHMTLGRYIRNEYGLWRGGPLADCFLARGVDHPDNMSGILLEAYGAYLRGETVDVDAMIRSGPRFEPAPGEP